MSTKQPADLNPSNVGDYFPIAVLSGDLALFERVHVYVIMSGLLHRNTSRRNVLYTDGRIVCSRRGIA